MPLARLPHWDTQLLHQFLTDNASKPFAWGSHDCCLFAANAIESFTGVDIADDFRSRYTDQISAFKLIRSVTAGTTVSDAAAFCADKHGLKEYEYPLTAKRGDLVVVRNTDDTLIAGIVHLNGRDIISVSQSGLVRLPITNITRAWSV